MSFTYSNANGYRKDIDGLRAIAVIAVIAFHFGLLPNGFLGVDVFFVISGYLITSIIYKEIINNKFSISNFYLRRTRRIFPLTLFVVLVALLIGIFVMLPDDLENLAQSVVATNLFANNMLQARTIRDYWSVINEFKPLMHTWSLGIEEQYYLIYPLLLMMIGKHYKKWLLPTLATLGVISLGLYFLPFEESDKFYYLPFRFFELALGGVAALCLNGKVVAHNYSLLFVIGLIAVLSSSLTIMPSQLTLLLAVLLTLGVIISDNSKSKITEFILKNRLSTAIGLISFSLYMWHQIVLSYFRYYIVQKIDSVNLLLVSVIIVALSVFSYYAIERPFRDKNRVSNKIVLSLLGVLFIVTTASALFLYSKGGVIRDVPELGIFKNEAYLNMHTQYNDRIYACDRSFSDDPHKIKVLAIGHSYARDWANIMLESKYKNLIEISYVKFPFIHPDIKDRCDKADIVFFYTADHRDMNLLGVDSSKFYVVGPKNFGVNNGYFYNYSGADYFKQRTLVDDYCLKLNDSLKNEWGARYVDIMAKVIDNKNTVPVFTNDSMFISQDCKHLTRSGAIFFARIFEDEIAKILKKYDSTK